MYISRKEKIFLTLITFISLFLGYFFIPLFVTDSYPKDTLLLWIDNRIPFIPISVWYYLFSYYLSFPLCIILVKKKINFHFSILSFLMTGLICFVFFYHFSVPYPRPTITDSYAIIPFAEYSVTHLPTDRFSVWGTSLLYQLDKSSNTFPSLHVAYAYIVYRTIKTEYPMFSKILGLNVFLIYITTLTTKQHFIVDGIFGFLVAYLSCEIILKLIKQNNRQKLSSDRKLLNAFGDSVRKEG